MSEEKETTQQSNLGLIIALIVAFLVIAGLSFYLFTRKDLKEAPREEEAPVISAETPQELGKKWFAQKIQETTDNKIMEWDKHYAKDGTFKTVKRTFDVKVIKKSEVKAINKGFRQDAPEGAVYLRATIRGNPGWFGKRGEYYDFYVVKEDGEWQMPAGSRFSALFPSGLLD